MHTPGKNMHVMPRTREKRLAYRFTSITIRYRSFILDPTVPKEGMLFSTFMEEKMGGPKRAKQMTDHVTKAGEATGITFNFDRVEYRPNTLASHLLLKKALHEVGAKL
jgi:predicted DsbA family dithiol-disulfide isomerase